MGCCLFAAVLAGAPRFAFLLWWFLQPGRISATFNTILWPLLGVIFLPWTTLAYVWVSPNGLGLFDWIILVIAIVIDLGSYSGGAYSRRRR